MKLFFYTIALLGLAGCGSGFRLNPNNNQALTNLQNLQVDVTVPTPNPSATPDPTQPAQSVPGYYVRPLGIDFGLAIALGVVVSNVAPPPATPTGTQNIPVDPPPPPPQFPFSFHLDIQTGVVTDKTSGTTVYTLNESDTLNLYNILIGSVITPMTNPNAGIACVTTYLPSYANLITDQGDYQLGGSPCSGVDLYRTGTHTSSGLQDYLNALQADIDGVQVQTGNVFGLYNLADISTLTYQREGGAQPPIAASVATQVTVTFDSSSGLTVASVTNGFCEGMQTLSSSQVTAIETDLTAATLGYDSNTTQIPVIEGAYHLTIGLTNGVSADYIFDGGSNPNNGPVIFGAALQSDLSQLFSTVPCGLPPSDPPTPVPMPATQP